MNGTPNILWRMSPQIWFFVGVPLFFLFFSAFYTPFEIKEWLDMDRGLFYFNVSIMTCIVLLVLVATRISLFFMRRRLDHSWLSYIGLCILEALVCSAFLALFTSLMEQGNYFNELGPCCKLVFFTNCFPYSIIILGETLYARLGEAQGNESSSLVRFYDNNKQLKFIIADDAIVYISAEENYVHIHYLDSGVLKDYQLRATMTSIETVATKAGLFRAHRSFYVNPSHIKALRKDSNGVFIADMDAEGVMIPVSKRVYPELSLLI